MSICDPNADTNNHRSRENPAHRFQIRYQSEPTMDEGEYENQNSLHNEEGELEENDNHNHNEGEQVYNQDTSVIESLQQDLRQYQDLETSYLENERYFYQRIAELEERETLLERDVDFYRRRRSISRSREHHHRSSRHEGSSRYRRSRSPSHSRRRSRHYRASRSPSSYQQYRNPSTSRDQDYSIAPAHSSRRPRSSSRSSELSPHYSPSKRQRRDSYDSYSQRDANRHSFSRSDFDDEEYNSDLGRSRTSERQSSPLTPYQEESSFPDKGETYIVFNKDKHHHVENQPSQIIWLGEKITVKWYEGDKNIKAFCQINEEDSSSSPYGTKSSANKFLRDILELTPNSESPGFKRSAFSTHFDINSGLGLALNIASASEEVLIHHLIAGDRKKAMSSFKDSAFEAPSTTIFSSGWPKGNHHFKWVKGDKLDLVKSADKLNLDKVDEKKKKDINILLEKELDTRTNLVNQITGLRNLEIFSDKIKNENNKRSTTLAIAKGFLPVLKFLLVDWMDAKIALRKAILHDQDTEAVRILLKADMWQPTIFAEESLKEIKSIKEPGLRKILNLNKDGSFKKPLSFQKGNPNTNSRGRPQPNKTLPRRSFNDRPKREEFKKNFYDQKFLDSRKTYNPSFVKADNSQEHTGTNQKGRNHQRGRPRGGKKQ